MDLLRFLAQLFVLVSIFAGTAAIVAVLILAVRFWPLMLIIVLTLAVFQLGSRRAHSTRR